jgi:hypothetical protein
MRKLFFIAIFSFCALSFSNATECSSGGEGASGCSVTLNLPGGGGVTYSVTCREGYYACCNAVVIGESGAKCVKESEESKGLG